MEQPYISIIIPVYNTEAYLPKCLDSIRNQSYTNWEAICIADEGSTDKSNEILEQYAAKDSRIKVFHQPHGGVSSARNLALSNCNGVYLSFVDSDDWISKEYYANIVRIINASEEEVSLVRLYIKPTDNREDSQTVGDDRYERFSRDAYFNDGRLGGHMQSLFVKKALVDAHRLHFEESMKVMEDQVFSMQCAMNATTILLYHRREYFYYQNPTSLTIRVKDHSLYYLHCGLLVQAYARSYSSPAIKTFISRYMVERLEGYINIKASIFKKYKSVVYEKKLVDEYMKAVGISASQLSLICCLKLAFIRLVGKKVDHR